MRSRTRKGVGIAQINEHPATSRREVGWPCTSVDQACTGSYYSQDTLSSLHTATLTVYMTRIECLQSMLHRYKACDRHNRYDHGHPEPELSRVVADTSYVRCIFCQAT